MRLVTWNINSVTARLERLLPWIEQAQPDVLALQELKCTEQAYPSALADLGYESVVHATGRWNGVALASRVGLAEPRVGLPDQPQFDGAIEPRAVAATCNGVRVWSVYVPNGREPSHDHYTYKLQWLDCLAQTCEAELAAAPDRPFAVIGDFNIAPTDADVWDISLFAESTHVTPAERTRLQALLDLGLQDLQPRSLKGAPFTFWDYRNGAFHRGWGMRIDLVLANAAFIRQATDCYIDREARKGKGASDHAPVVVDLKTAGMAGAA
jgi:exodeoxyribonuclease-3